MKFEYERAKKLILNLVDSWEESEETHSDHHVDHRLREEEIPEAYYARCISETQSHAVLEKALLHGYVKPCNLRSTFGSKVASFIEQQMNKLFTYQLVMRTIGRLSTIHI